MAKVEVRSKCKWWYGRLNINGVRRAFNLSLVVEGIRPCREFPNGDEVFVASRAAAEAKLESLRLDSLKKAQTQDILQALHVARTGKKVGAVPLTLLAEKWAAIPRRRTVSADYGKWAQSLMSRFVMFLREQRPPRTEMSDVDEDLAQQFLIRETARGISPRTWNSELVFLRSVFRHLRKQAGMPENPFDGIPTREENPIHRRPFSNDDLQVILQAAKEDPLIYPIIVAGMCTAMRLGDVCTLKWADVDIVHGFINVKTSKTGAHVSIPIFPLLLDELRVRPKVGVHVFPEVARVYKDGNDAIHRRLQQIFTKAGFFDRSRTRKTLAAPGRPDDWAKRAAKAVHDSPMQESRKTKLLQVLSLYAAGTGTAGIAKNVELSKGAVSNYLHEIETLAGFPIVRRLVERAQTIAPHRADMRATRENGLRQASIHGFHSFRTTWVTLALTAGVPVDIVRKVTGHRTADIVLQNYFQPGREQFRQVLQSKMPALLSNGAKTPQEEAIAVLRDVTPRTWRKAIDRALALLTGQAA